MGVFSDFKDFYEDVEVPTINVYDPDYIKEKIRVLKSNPIRNRFRLCNERRFAVRGTGLEEDTHEPKNVMTYEEKRAEARKPIYREYAKIIWTKTYVLFKTDFEYEISTIARNILSSIEMESKYNISYSIFEVIPLVSFDEKKKFMQAYIDQLSSITSYKFNPLKFIQDNIDSICNGNKLNELISLFKSISDYCCPIKIASVIKSRLSRVSIRD